MARNKNIEEEIKYNQDRVNKNIIVEYKNEE